MTQQSPDSRQTSTTTTIMADELHKDPLSPTSVTPLPNDDKSTSTSIPRSASFRSLIAAYEKPFNKDRDAGNKPLDHYKSRLGPLRNRWRNAVLPLIRWETPILAKIQKRLRNPFLDIYFALTANLGTHTCYVIMLPISFWYGHSRLGRSLTFCLAFGVYITNFFKDLLCLPRPLSPPLHRLTMSGSAALEYGFPSTHTANSVSVSLILAEALINSKDTYASLNYYYALHFLNGLYLFSIVTGRIYCGMHGFLDIIGGLLIGSGLWWFRLVYGNAMDSIVLSSSYHALWVIPIALILIRIHPEPADDCPCFDDGVAFLGVVAGVVVGEWHFTGTKYAQIPATINSIPFNFAKVGVLGIVCRFLVGSILISIWRPSMKRALYEVLPPLFRFIEKIGLSMPRRYFTPASQYGDIPSSLPDTTFFEPQNITSLFTKVGRTRADSVGPQSTADVYESIAYREYQKEKEEEAHRRNSSTASADKQKQMSENSESYSTSFKSHLTGANAQDSFACYSDDDSENTSNKTQNQNSCHCTKRGHGNDSTTADEEENEAEGAIMSTIIVPRVRYDVEVVTKLIVYSGIGFIAVEVAGTTFGILGI